MNSEAKSGFRRDAQFPSTVDAYAAGVVAGREEAAAVIAALRAVRRNVDVSTIRPGKRVEARWIELIERADEALRKFEGTK